jgi:hypothetical protein
MNYQKIHNLIVDRARTRVISGYYEEHHVVPKCLGGTDSADNLVALTAREHFLIHKLLTKLYPDNDKIVFAAWMMFAVNKQTQKRRARDYGRLKEKHAAAMSRLHKGKTISVENRAAVSARFKGKPTWNKGLKTGPSPRRGIKGIGGRPKGSKNSYVLPPPSAERNARLSASMKKSFSPSWNTQGLEVLTPTGFQKFDGVAYKGLVHTLKFTMSDKSTIECSNKHVFITPEGEKRAQDCAVGDMLTEALSVLDIVNNGKKRVFDLLEVAGGHVYNTNNVVSHNCEFRSDEIGAVIPEWNKYKSSLVADETEIPRPPFYYPIVTIDLGLTDFTGVLFGYWHFQKGMLIIEDELLLKGVNSEKLVSRCREKELVLWGEEPIKHPVRVADGQNYTIHDITTVHGYAVGTQQDKSNLESQVNTLRLDVQGCRISINPRCVLLLGQLEDVTWDKSRTTFNRDAKNGHFDLIAALLYAAKYVNRHSNPYPPNYQLNTREMMMHEDRKHNSPTMNSLKRLFAPKQVDDRDRHSPSEHMVAIFSEPKPRKKVLV